MGKSVFKVTGIKDQRSASEPLLNSWLNVSCQTYKSCMKGLRYFSEGTCFLGGIASFRITPERKQKTRCRYVKHVKQFSKATIFQFTTVCVRIMWYLRLYFNFLIGMVQSLKCTNFCCLPQRYLCFSVQDRVLETAPIEAQQTKRFQIRQCLSMNHLRFFRVRFFCRCFLCGIAVYIDSKPRGNGFDPIRRFLLILLEKKLSVYCHGPSWLESCQCSLECRLDVR